MEIFYRFEDLKDNELGIEFIETFLMNMEYKVMKISTTKKRFENDY
jgi:hypothetical protein